MHPHIGNLSSLSDNQLEEKILDLQKKYWTSNNEQIKSQIILLLDDYKYEADIRRARAAEKQRQDNGESGLDSLINIS